MDNHAIAEVAGELDCKLSALLENLSVPRVSRKLRGVDEVTMLSQAPDGVVTKTSARPVPATLERLQIAVQEQGLMVFALVDHSGQADKAGLAMPDTKLLIFGSPAGGTQIMLAAPLAALDLPLKVLVWENPAGGSFVSYLDPAYLGARHQLTDDLTARITGINTITDAAVAP